MIHKNQVLTCTKSQNGTYEVKLDNEQFMYNRKSSKGPDSNNEKSSERSTFFHNKACTF